MIVYNVENLFVDKLDKDEYTTSAFLYLSKAFDSVSHPILLETIT